MKSILAVSSLLLGAAAFAAPSVDDGQCGSTCGATSRAALASNVVAESDIVTTAIEAGSFKILARLLTAADLVETLQGKGPFTVVAPTDAAFEALLKADPKLLDTLLKKENKGLLQSILTHHVIAGKVMSKTVVTLTTATTLSGQRVDISFDKKAGVVSIDGATVTAADIGCTNGVIHVIDTVLMPETKNLVEVAAGAKTFGTLIAAAKAAGLAGALSDGGPFTLFAPNDKAFAALPAGTVEALLKPENKARLAAILKHHVVSGRVYADQAAKLDSAKTIGDTTLAIKIGKDSATVGGANIIATDIEASNGVIHVVDAVILPQ